MVLTSGDVGGARVTGQRYFRDSDFPSVISYVRAFENGAVGRTPLSYAESQAQVGKSAATTSAFLAALRVFAGSKEGREALTTALKEGVGTDAFITGIKVLPPRNLGVGPGSFDVLVTARLLERRIDLHFAAFAVERVLGVVTAIGNTNNRVPLAVMTRLARVQAVRTIIEVVPQSLAPPAISGTPAVRERLSASPGRWTGRPASFSYRWQRCSAAGSGCTAIGGATARTYVVTDADVGSRIRVDVTARGLVRSDPETSSATEVVVVFIDAFDGTGPNASWSLGTTGTGPRIVQTNGQLEVTLPVGTAMGPQGFANAFAMLTCRLTGDFDMQVDYRLLSGLLPTDGINVGFDAAEFTGGTYSGQHGMFVHNAGGNNHGIHTHFPEGGDGFVSDSSRSGTLRLVRTTSGGVTTVTASRLTGSPWSFTSQPYAVPTSQVANLNLFTNLSPLPSQVVVAYDNFRITSGALTCP